jgi:transcriptional regulator with XRE-family HTH domain
MVMTDNTLNRRSSAATHLGRQMKRDRQAQGWSLRELAARTGVNFSTLSQVENGKRPFSEKLAIKCDELFPERRGWYLTYYDESKSWTPPGFRNWPEFEDKSATLRTWSPGILHGLVQTEAYARRVLETLPDATQEIVAGRLAGRMARQQRILYRDDAPAVWFVVDELSLYRRVGSPEIMAEQMRQLARIARLPNVTVQVFPAVEHPANASELIIADNAAYIEHLAGGLVYTDDQMITSLTRLFTTIHAEANKASDSLAAIERMGHIWTGVRAATAATRKVTASRSARATA